MIVPSISWATTYCPLQQYGLKLKFLDIELDKLNMDVSQLERALTPRTRMVVAVSILGNPCALDVLRKFCDKHGLYLFEDNCESMGAELGGKPCGTFGDIGTFSTFPPPPSHLDHGRRCAGGERYGDVSLSWAPALTCTSKLESVCRR